MAGQQREGIEGEGQGDDAYADVLDLHGYYFVYVCVMDPTGPAIWRIGRWQSAGERIGWHCFPIGIL